FAKSTAAAAVDLEGTGSWRLEGSDGRGGVLVRGASGERWRVERRARRLRAVRADGLGSVWRDGPLVARSVGGEALLSVGGRRYRGEIVLSATDSGVMVVNRLPMEEYLRGVVPLEIGTDRRADEHAAVEAQAVAARSYTVARLRGTTRQSYDLGAGVTDQVYGGASAERPVSDAAVRATSGLVLLAAGRVVTAPYHAACGGTTAEPPEVWRSGREPHLRRVSDRIPGTDRNYCDIAPQATWSRTLEQDALRRAVDHYLPAYASLPAGGVGTVRELRVESTTPSGRVGTLALVTDRGIFRLRGNEIRYVLRDAAGGILRSTYFTLRRSPVRRGESAPMAILEGRGNGHGIGMCQWGAIGRARAGQDFRAILSTYYPGTSVGYAR
ncbi:MAG: SpoIID/LytB domain-containing protein, partial [Gemmatimonadaceae bacterium]